MTKHGILLWQTAKAPLKFLKMSKPKESIFWGSAHYGSKLSRINMRARKIMSKLVYQRNRREQLEMPP
jgi:hypothetical protein